MVKTHKNKSVSNRKNQTSRKSVKNFMKKRKKKQTIDSSSGSSDDSYQSGDESQSGTVLRTISHNRRKLWKPMSSRTVRIISDMMENAKMSVLSEVKKSDREEFRKQWEAFKRKFLSDLEKESAPVQKIDYDDLHNLCNKASQTLDELQKMLTPLDDAVKQEERIIQELEKEIIVLESEAVPCNGEYELHPLLQGASND